MLITKYGNFAATSKHWGASFCRSKGCRVVYVINVWVQVIQGCLSLSGLGRHACFTPASSLLHPCFLPFIRPEVLPEQAGNLCPLSLAYLRQGVVIVLEFRGGALSHLSASACRLANQDGKSELDAC